MEHLRQPEFEKVYSRTTQQFRQMVETRPQYKKVAKDFPNPHTINVLEWMAMVVLIVLSVMTSYKVGAAAVPYGKNMMEALTAKQYVVGWVQDSFIFVSAVFFMLMATPALIYFKLLDRDPKVEKERIETQRRSKLSLDYLTPRLPSVMVYGIVIWLLLVSSHGLVLDVNDPIFSAARFFEVYLPVVIEVALAVLVGNILEKRKKFSDLIRANMRETNDRIDRELENYATDKRFLKMLYRNLREAFLQLERPSKDNNRRTYQPNLELENDAKLDSILIAQYKRLTGGDNFVAGVADEQQPRGLEPELPTVGKRVPPNGSANWTVAGLIHDLKLRGIGDTYTEAQLSADYAAGYGARAAWRGGAKNYAGSGT